jgi:hypothetical protein
MVQSLFAEDVSERVAELVARHDQGDRRAAARRLGIDQECLTGLLSGDWNLFSLDGLAALVRVYGVGPAWLIAARACPNVAPVAPGAFSRKAR